MKKSVLDVRLGDAYRTADAPSPPPRSVMPPRDVTDRIARAIGEPYDTAHELVLKIAADPDPLKPNTLPAQPKVLRQMLDVVRDRRGTELLREGFALDVQRLRNAVHHYLARLRPPPNRKTKRLMAEAHRAAERELARKQRERTTTKRVVFTHVSTTPTGVTRTEAPADLSAPTPSESE